MRQMCLRAGSERLSHFGHRSRSPRRRGLPTVSATRLDRDRNYPVESDRDGCSRERTDQPSARRRPAPAEVRPRARPGPETSSLLIKWLLENNAEYVDCQRACLSKSARFRGGRSGLPTNRWFLRSIRVQVPNGILIGSAVFAARGDQDRPRSDAARTGRSDRRGSQTSSLLVSVPSQELGWEEQCRQPVQSRGVVDRAFEVQERG